MNIKQLLNPNTEFLYVNDSVLWNTLFTSPFPKDIKNTRKGSVTLSDYFTIETCFIPTDTGHNKEQKFIGPNERYCDVDEYERNTVFTVLCDFLIRYKRPYRKCYIYVSNHETIEREEDMEPMSIYYSIPQYPSINRKQNHLQLQLQPETFCVTYMYCFGEKPTVPIGSIPIMSFQYESFHGFMLDH